MVHRLCALQAALREMLYGSGEQKALNVTRLTKLSTAAQSFRDMVIEAPPRPAATDAKPSGSGRAASEVADILLAAEGNYLQARLSPKPFSALPPLTTAPPFPLSPLPHRYHAGSPPRLSSSHSPPPSHHCPTGCRSCW